MSRLSEPTAKFAKKTGLPDIGSDIIRGIFQTPFEDASEAVKKGQTSAIDQQLSSLEQSLGLTESFRELGAEAAGVLAQNVGEDSPLIAQAQATGESRISQELEGLGLGNVTGATTERFKEGFGAAEEIRRFGRLSDLLQIGAGSAASGAGLSQIVGQNLSQGLVKAGESQAGLQIDLAALAAQTGATTIKGIQKSQQDRLLLDLLKSNGKAKV